MLHHPKHSIHTHITVWQATCLVLSWDANFLEGKKYKNIFIWSRRLLSTIRKSTHVRMLTSLFINKKFRFLDMTGGHFLRLEVSSQRSYTFGSHKKKKKKRGLDFLKHSEYRGWWTPSGERDPLFLTTDFEEKATRLPTQNDAFINVCTKVKMEPDTLPQCRGRSLKGICCYHANNRCGIFEFEWANTHTRFGSLTWPPEYAKSSELNWASKPFPKNELLLYPRLSLINSSFTLYWFILNSNLFISYLIFIYPEI